MKKIAEMCERYNELPAEDKYLIDCAPHLGKYRFNLT